MLSHEALLRNSLIRSFQARAAPSAAPSTSARFRIEEHTAPSRPRLSTSFDPVRVHNLIEANANVYHTKRQIEQVTVQQPEHQEEQPQYQEVVWEGFS